MSRASTFSFRLAAGASAAVVALAAQAASADVLAEYQKVALTTEAAPGTALFWRAFDAPAITASGKIAFHGTYGTNEHTNLTSAIWAMVDSEAGIGLVANAGATAPGTTDTWVGFGGARVGISDTGDVIFRGTLSSPTATDAGIWFGPTTGGSNSVPLFVREDDLVNSRVEPDVNFASSPFNGVAPRFNSNLGLASISPAGAVGGFTSPMDTDVDNGLSEHSFFAGTATGMQYLAIAGTQVPGEAANTLYGGAAVNLRINATGHVAYAATLKGGAEPDFPSAIFYGAPGNVQVVAAVGRQAPGMDTGVTFHSVQHPDLNESGSVAFVAGLNNFDSDVDAFRGEAIYFGQRDLGTQTSNISPVLKIGDEVQGIAGRTVKDFPSLVGPTINDLGMITFLTTLEGTGITNLNDLAIMAGDPLDPENLVVVAQESDLTGQGHTLPVGFTLLDGPIIGNGGHIAFSISQTDGGSSLWMSDLDGNLLRIVGTGDDFDVGDGGPFREVILLKTGTTNDGYRFLTDDGTVIFGLAFADGSEGIFTATMLIPEPAGAAAALGALGLLLCRRRRSA